MATSKVLSLRQLPILSPTTCWNVSIQRTARISANGKNILKKFGFPQQPKKPVSAYIDFFNCIRQDLKARNPKMTFIELSQAVSKKWKELPSAEKQTFQENFDERMKNYRADLEEYNKQLTDQEKEDMKQVMMGYLMQQKQKSIINEIKKLEKRLNKPKLPLNPFFKFYTTNYQGTDGKRIFEKVKEMKLKWDECPEAEKQKFKEMFRKEREQYKKDLEEWEEQMMRKGSVDAVRLKTLRRKLENVE